MKKIIALLLSCLLCATCFAVFASAEEYGAASLLPNPDGEMTAEGCEVKVNSNGSVTVTLTAATASIKMILSFRRKPRHFTTTRVYLLRKTRNASVENQSGRSCPRKTRALPSHARNLREEIARLLL